MSTVLLIGSGGREHAIAWSLAKSPLVSRILLSPGNPGIARSDKVSLVSTDDAQDLCNLCTSQSVDLAVIGPEAPLTAGLADQLIRAGIPVFGPSKLAARIEGSKAFSKEFMERNGIPTAKFQVFTEFERAREFVEKNFDPEKGIVLKVSGLAAGKGVVLPRTLDEAVQTLKEFMVEKIFGDAGNEVVVEELLVGEEVSCLAFTDGFSISLCPPAQDHKRLLDNDEGPNTGGMGAYAPAPILTPELRNLVIEKVLKPAVDGLRKEGTPFVGILYAGVMICPQKEIPTQVLEFNCRFGDPETQCILPLLQSDLYKIMYACATRCLDSVEVRWAPAGSAAVTVIAASRGYPKQSFQPEVIDIKSQDDTNSVLFHAGTSENSKNELLASGGRVLAITGISEKGLSEALNIAYNRLSTVSFSGMQFRKDIAQKAFRSSDSKNLANKSPQSGDFALVLPTTAFSCTGLPYAHEYLKKFDWNEKRTDLGGASISESLSTPFPSYSDQFSLLKKHGVNIKAIIPVAGSSLMLSSQSLDSYLALLLEKGSWEIPQILKLIQREGNVM
jgi:phosphoribosylamine--glycine ligase/phosphoribosylformylglycinamidine cyclo-ligase